MEDLRGAGIETPERWEEGFRAKDLYYYHTAAWQREFALQSVQAADGIPKQFCDQVCLPTLSGNVSGH